MRDYHTNFTPRTWYGWEAKKSGNGNLMDDYRMLTVEAGDFSSANVPCCFVHGVAT